MRQSITRYLVCILLPFCLVSCDIQGERLSYQRETSVADHSSKTLYPVKKVVDGDTFWVDNGTEKGMKIRVIGVDAPESRKAFKHDIEYFGKEAKAYMEQLIGGKSVRLVSDVDSLDSFGRTLSYVYLEDGTFVNAELIKNGYAVLMTISPNVEFAEHFAELQKEARENEKGLWGKKPD